MFLTFLPTSPPWPPTDPHHKHIRLGIKHHRIPTSELSFTRPNLPVLIEEVEQLLKEG